MYYNVFKYCQIAPKCSWNGIFYHKSPLFISVMLEALLSFLDETIFSVKKWFLFEKLNLWRGTNCKLLPKRSDRCCKREENSGRPGSGRRREGRPKVGLGEAGSMLSMSGVGRAPRKQVVSHSGQAHWPQPRVCTLVARRGAQRGGARKGAMARELSHRWCCPFRPERHAVGLRGITGLAPAPVLAPVSPANLFSLPRPLHLCLWSPCFMADRHAVLVLSSSFSSLAFTTPCHCHCHCHSASASASAIFVLIFQVEGCCRCSSWLRGFVFFVFLLECCGVRYS